MSLDPVDNAVVAKVADLTPEEVREAISIAHESFHTWKKTPPRQRRFLIRAWSDLIKANRHDLAAICTLELAKPISESLVTVDYGVSFLDWFETQIEHLNGETIPAERSDNRIFTIRQPQGVVAAITPWNSPVAMVTRKVGAAIAAGNTVVLKPAPETPLSAIALAKLAQRAGIPNGVFNVVTTSLANTAAVGKELCENRLVRHLSFTGSTNVGKFLNGECAIRMKRVSMELGGNAPFIVFQDANLDKAVDGLITSKFRSSGQTCVCANRILVHQKIIKQFAERLQEKLGKALTAGDVWDPKTNYGPLYSGKAVDKVKRHLEDAQSRGFELLLGGIPDAQHQFGPNYITPTVLIHEENISALRDLEISREETFGPMAALIPFATEEEAIAAANNSDFGLASYFYTEDISRIWRVAEALNTGMVGVRVGLVSAAEQPFGGIMYSGIGREGGSNSLEDYTEIKSITLGL
jgi:succinate-semialdehyde dehydrogenase/glutarate-semialdehyde dehydrogenase